MQDWSNTAQITANDNWTGVPGIEGYFLNSTNSSTGIDPQTVLTDTFNNATTTVDLDVIANQTNPDTNNTGGVAEFHTTQQAAPANANPTIALNGSGTADAPFILLYLNTTGQSGINVAYNLRDIDCTVDNSTQPVALQFRVGNSGSYTNVPAGFVSDATAQTNNTATDVANCTLVTAVSAALPAAANNQPLVQVRILTTNAAGNDEWVGIDNINVTTSGPAPDIAPTVASTTPADNALNISAASNISVTFSEPVTATASSFTISCNQSGAHAFALSGGPTTYTLDPTTDFTPGEVCTVTVIAAQVTDQDGTPNQMAQDYVFDFTVVNSGPVKINQIQGNNTASPLAGQVVTTSGIVTLLRTSTNNGGAASGFFLQEPTATNDADPNTSEGIFVFTTSVPAVGVGDNVTVTGTVSEFNGLTEITPSSAPTVNSTGNGLPDAVVLTTTILDPAAPPTQPQLEKYEGMRLSAASLKTVAPNDSFFDVDTVLGTVPRPLREPGIEISQPVPPDPTTGTPDCCIPRWDENPERLSVDTNGRAGAAVNPYTSNVTFTNIAGPLDFAFDRYRLIPETTLNASANMNAVPVPTPTSNEFTVGGFNVENFANGATQRQKAALAIRDVMKLPDIIGMVEIFELSGLQALAAEVNAISPGANYQARLVEADNTSGDADQDVGFLVNTARVNIDSVTQIELAGCNGTAATCNTFIDPNTGQPAYLNDRPPLVLRAHVQPAGANLPVIVVVNHLRSFIDIETITGEGPRVRAKRKAQAEFLADLLQDLQTDNPGTSVISVGDYNAYQFSDGYTDPLSVIKGIPTPDDQIVVDQSPDLVNPNYTNLIDELPADQRYSFIFEGTPQALDHVIVNTAAYARKTRIAIARNNADFPEAPAATYLSNATRPERNSDHDMPVAYFALAGAVTQPGTVLISEFRFNGPNGTGDEFIELYNNSDSPVSLNGWTIAAPAGTGGGGVVSGITGQILARSHFLVAPSDYSVAGYPSNGIVTAVPDQAYTGGAFLDDGGAQLRDLNGAAIDSVGFSSANGTGFREGAGLSPSTGVTPTASDQYSFVRKMTSGFPQDTNDNAADFVLVSTSGTVGATIAILGAPGPENSAAPIQRNGAIKASNVDTCAGAGTCQNRVRVGTQVTNGAFGTLKIRRKFTNTTTENVTRLRFRVVDITTLNSPGYAPGNSQADLRVVPSDASNFTVTLSTGESAPVAGTQVETPPAQTLGGGLNSSIVLITPVGIAPGASVNVEFNLGVQQSGSFRFFVNVEALTGGPVAAFEDGTKTPPGKKNAKQQ
ncbi:MAG TPA: Ig-like domain-containing protein [Pyrinomonadaceae bacterium]|nr:Ig-like domain-containing protein [Pyrinomonadaceae bacterium]